MSTAQPTIKSLKDKIHTIRGVHVMLDRNLAELYEVSTKALNQAVKRNKERFPEKFTFQITNEEKQELVTNCDHLQSLKYSYQTPNVFTEQGVAMLSAVLKSEKAVKVSIQIMEAFVEMRKIIRNNQPLLTRMNTVETKLLEHDKHIHGIFKTIEDKQLLPDKGIFYNGQVFDAHKLASDLVRTATKSIILIDNYVNDTTLSILAKRKKTIPATIYTKNITKQLKLDVKKHNEQYQAVQLKEFKDAHDRFLIIDNTTVYHIGASLKDLGKKWFAFSKMNKNALEMIAKLE